MNRTLTINDLPIAFFMLGLTAFSGPARVAHIRALTNQHNQWLTENDFYNGIALCQSIPSTMTSKPLPEFNRRAFHPVILINKTHPVI